MGKDKLKKFAEIGTFSNVLQLEEGKVRKGRWSEDQFGNDHPIVLELACGEGEYTVKLAKLEPDRNFIGVDFKGNRIWRGAKTALEEEIPNVAFLRIQIEDILDYFAAGEVAEIWITFPDPQPQKGRIKKRLTNPTFLTKYKWIAAENAKLHLKTDNDDFYRYTLETLEEFGALVRQATDDVYQSGFVTPELAIKTYYERKYLAEDKRINYVQWQFQ